MEINAKIPTLYKAAMEIYENVIEKKEQYFLVKLQLQPNDDLYLLQVFLELAKEISDDFNVQVELQMV
jgi:hypothetical protein